VLLTTSEWLIDDGSFCRAQSAATGRRPVIAWGWGPAHNKKC
jgi:hypothetical protein